MSPGTENPPHFTTGPRVAPDGRTVHTLYQPNGEVANWILEQFEPGYVGYAIDVGASDGKSINSTWVLEKQNRWKVLSVEANPYFKAILNEQRSMVRMCAVSDRNEDDVLFHINLDNLEAYSALKASDHPKFKAKAGNRWAQCKVQVRTLDFLLNEWSFPRLDALCIDTEGTEPDVLKGLDIEKWKPKVILVECWDEGAHDAYLNPLGYERKYRSVDNDGYTRLA